MACWGTRRLWVRCGRRSFIRVIGCRLVLLCCFDLPSVVGVSLYLTHSFSDRWESGSCRGGGSASRLCGLPLRAGAYLPGNDASRVAGGGLRDELGARGVCRSLEDNGSGRWWFRWRCPDSGPGWIVGLLRLKKQTCYAWMESTCGEGT